MVRTTVKKQAKQERSRATFDAILTAAARLLVRDGYDHTTTTRIAETAGVSIGSLYQYFPSKEAIVAELIDRHMEKTFALVAGEMAGLAAAPVAQAVPRLIDVFVRAYAVDKRLRRVFIEQVPRFGRLSRVRALEGRLSTLVERYFRTHAREIGRSDYEIVTFVVLASVTSVTYAAAIEDTRIPTDILVKELAHLVLSYLGTPDPGPGTVAAHK